MAKLAGVGIPGLVLLVVMSGTGWAGGVAIATALAFLGGPAGMIGGISVLVLMGIIAAALAKYGVDAIAKGVVRKLKREGETDDRAAASILAVMDGLQTQWLLDPTAVELGETAEFAIEAIVAQVLSPRSTPLSDAPGSASTA